MEPLLKFSVDQAATWTDGTAQEERIVRIREAYLRALRRSGRAIPKEGKWGLKMRFHLKSLENPASTANLPDLDNLVKPVVDALSRHTEYPLKEHMPLLDDNVSHLVYIEAQAEAGSEDRTVVEMFHFGDAPPKPLMSPGGAPPLRRTLRPVSRPIRIPLAQTWGTDDDRRRNEVREAIAEDLKKCHLPSGRERGIFGLLITVTLRTERQKGQWPDLDNVAKLLIDALNREVADEDGANDELRQLLPFPNDNVHYLRYLGIWSHKPTTDNPEKTDETEFIILYA